MKRNWSERGVPPWRAPAGLALGLLSVSGCEDGPTGDYDPSSEVASLQSAPAQSAPDAQRGFDSVTEGGERGSARFCDEAELTALIEQLVTRPMQPDESLGGIPLWAPDGAPMRADDLVGNPEEGKLCEPSAEFADAFTWGPVNEVAVFFNPETRLITSVAALSGYQGALNASYQAEGGEVAVEVRVRERLRLAGAELDEYASRADQASRGASWLNEQNVTQLYLAVRQTFFGQAPNLDPAFNCVASQLCDVIYTSADESVPQTTVVVLQDSGVQVNFSPEGQVTAVVLDPVRVAPFEVAGSVATLAPAPGTGAGEASGVSPDAGVPVAPEDPPTGFVDAGAPEESFDAGPFEPVAEEPQASPSLPGPGSGVFTGSISPGFVSRSVPGCRLDLAGLSWSGFLDRCVQQERTLQRVDFNVHAQRDGVTASFNGLWLDFLRNTTERGVLADGEPPAAEDALYAITVTRSSSAPVAQFVPSQLSVLYKERLEAQLRGLVAPGAAPEHPVLQWELPLPPLPTAPQRLSALTVPTSAGPVPWLEQVQAQLEQLYASLPAVERAQVDPRLVDPVWIRQPFTHAVLSAASGGRADAPRALRQFRTTQDERWSIGTVSVVDEGVPYRFTAQYSLNFGAITALTVERGRSEVDELFAGLNVPLRKALGAPPSDYYDIGIAVPQSPLGLGGSALQVLRFDRRRGTVDVEIELPGAEPLALTVPGASMDDSSGFLRQIRGERFEFVPSHLVRLLGKETSFDFRVDAEGAIVALTQNRFKGVVRLCPTLPVEYGVDVPRRIEQWRAALGDSVHRECELVLNYSEDGNVLQSVASVVNRTSVSVIAGRAQSATVWQ